MLSPSFDPTAHTASDINRTGVNSTVVDPITAFMLYDIYVTSTNEVGQLPVVTIDGDRIGLRSKQVTSLPDVSLQGVLYLFYL